MTEQEMKIEMYRAMVDLLGKGYVPSYYEQAAGDFIGIAKAYATDNARLEKAVEFLMPRLKGMPPEQRKEQMRSFDIIEKAARELEGE